MDQTLTPEIIERISKKLPPDEAVEFAKHWLGKRLITYQTDSNGQLVNSILVEECTDIDKELYLSAVVDRGTQRIVFIGSSEGGVNIEEVADKTPEKIIYEPIDPLTGPMAFQARKISKVLGLNAVSALVREDKIPIGCADLGNASKIFLRSSSTTDCAFISA